MLKFGLQLKHPHPQEAVQKPLGEMASPEIAAAWRKAEFSILPGQTSWWETKKKKRKHTQRWISRGKNPAWHLLFMLGASLPLAGGNLLQGVGFLAEYIPRRWQSGAQFNC